MPYGCLSAHAPRTLQLSFDETEDFCEPFMDLDDGRNMWSTPGPRGKSLVWMMDAYRAMDPHLLGVCVGTRLQDGGVIIGTEGMYFLLILA